MKREVRLKKQFHSDIKGAIQQADDCDVQRTNLFNSYRAEAAWCLLITFTAPP